MTDASPWHDQVLCRFIFQISQGFTIQAVDDELCREATEIDKMIAVSDTHVCQVKTSSRNNIELTTPTTGAVRTDIAAIVVGSLAIKNAHKI